MEKMARAMLPVRRAGKGLVPSATAGEMRIAAIDVGSNSIHIMVAQIDAAGGLTVLWRAKEMVGLGRISFPSHRLTKEAMHRAVLTLRRYASEAQRWQCERVIAVATSAVREAENGGEFIEQVRVELGVHVRVVSAREEARLIYLGVKHGMDLRYGPHLIVDIGGGSVEFIVADSEKALLLESRKLGATRMTAKFIKSDPVQGKELKNLLAHYEQEFATLIDPIRKLNPTTVVGTSGAMWNLVAMASPDENHDESSVLRRANLEKIIGRLIESTWEDRAKMPGLDDKRRDQILAAALLVQELLRRLNLNEIKLCQSALREGILLDYLARHRPEMEIRSQVPSPRRRSVLDLGRRCHWNPHHAEQVSKLALRLFDQLRPLHKLPREDRELIEYAAQLHDIGSLIGREKHHKHSKYLIEHGDLTGFLPEEISIIANIARYHRKSFPTKDHKSYAKLSRHGRRVVKVGAALLRIADGLDRTNCAVVDELIVRVRPSEVQVLVKAKFDAELELWSAGSRSKLFQKVFGRDVVIKLLD